MATKSLGNVMTTRMDPFEKSRLSILVVLPIGWNGLKRLLGKTGSYRIKYIF